MSSKEYILRNRDDNELNRLGFQHEVWKEETYIAIEQGRIQPGDKIIDLGCGPGYLSLDLLKITGEEGQVFGIDSSQKFISIMLEMSINNLNPLHADIRDDLLLTNPVLAGADNVFCRWVLMFTGRVNIITKNVYNILKKDGIFISMEYFDFQKISVFPHQESFENIYNNVWKLIKKQGGNPDIGSTMKEEMLLAGFRKVDTYPMIKKGYSGSSLWKWLELTNTNHTNLVATGLITKNELEQYYRDWERLSSQKDAYITAPPLMITVGVK